MLLNQLKWQCMIINSEGTRALFEVFDISKDRAHSSHIVSI